MKLYRFIEDRTLELVLIKLSDLTTEKPIQIKTFEPLIVEMDIFEPIVVEPINDNSTNGNITRNNVAVHYHNHIFIWFGVVHVCNY